jgi:hypothetical protein
MPALNPFPFVLSSSCTTSYLPLNPALGREFSREFSLCGVFPNIIYTHPKYSFLILHAHAAIWKKTEMLTTTGTASHRDKGEVTLTVQG